MYNKVILIGRLTATPEMVKTASDRSFTRVTVAVNRRYKTQMVSVRLTLLQWLSGGVWLRP